MSKLDSTELNLLPSATTMNHTQPAQAPNISLEKNEMFEKNLEALTMARDNDIKNLNMMSQQPQQQPQPQQQQQQYQAQQQYQPQQQHTNNQMNTNIRNSSNGMDHTMINQIVNGIQQASASGLTALRSRDIPMNTSQINQDPETLPNYLPSMPINKKDYISNITSSQDIINKYMIDKNKNDSINTIYDELQTPILISILYFLFQLPVVKSYLFKYAPSLFNKDGNNNLFGFIFNSILFGLSYYLILNLLNYVSI